MVVNHTFRPSFFKIRSADPKEIHMLATSQTMILLSSRKVPSLDPRCDLICASMDIPCIWNLRQRSHNFLTLKTII